MRIYKVERASCFIRVSNEIFIIRNSRDVREIDLKTLLNIENGFPSNMNVISNPILKWLIKIS